MNPKISVVMSAYKADKYLRECIESILNQTFTDFEFVIVNDCSTDKTSEILNFYSDKDSRIKIINNTKNIGLTKSLNIALKESKGEYIARMDADDICMPERFQKQFDFLESNKDHVLVGSWMKIINENGEEIDEWESEVNNEKIKEKLIRYNPLSHSSIMIRTSLLIEEGGYNEKWRYAQDYELYFRLARLGKFANLPECLLKSRHSKKSITSSKNTAQSLCALRARWSGIKSGDYSLGNIIFLMRPILGILLPKSFKDLYK